MSNKFNQHIALWVGLLSATLAAGNVVAAECGQAKLIEAGSAGVSIIQNDCLEPSRVAVGSVLELSSGSRMWLKFDPNSRGEGLQLICQNKSGNAINVNITSTTTPWIKPEGLKNCNQWSHNKLICDGSNGEKNSFFCALASAKSTASATTKEVQPVMRTSVTMRSPFGKVDVVPVEEIIKAIKPDIELCKSLYNVTEKVEMSWTVSLGIIKDLNVKSENKDFIACAEGVAKQANANQDLSVKYSF